MKLYSIFLLCYLILDTTKSVDAQFNIYGGSHLGRSIQNKKAFFPTQNIFCYDVGIGYLTDLKIIFFLEYQRTIFSEKLNSIKNFRSHSLLPGIGYSTSIKQRKLDLFGYLSYSRVSFINDKIPRADYSHFHNESLWSQWGMKIGATYFLKPWFGVSLNYHRFCARRYDPGNYQSFIAAGIIFKWPEKMKAAE